MREVLLSCIKWPFLHCAKTQLQIYNMSHRPSKRAKRAPETIQRGAHIEKSTSRGVRSRNVGIAPAPTVGTSQQHTQREGTNAPPSFNAPDHMDFFVPTAEEVRTAYGKVVHSFFTKHLLTRSELDTK